VPLHRESQHGLAASSDPIDPADPTNQPRCLSRAHHALSALGVGTSAAAFAGRLVALKTSGWR
jgi:hypothetical protein